MSQHISWGRLAPGVVISAIIGAMSLTASSYFLRPFVFSASAQTPKLTPGVTGTAQSVSGPAIGIQMNPGPTYYNLTTVLTPSATQTQTAVSQTPYAFYKEPVPKGVNCGSMCNKLMTNSHIENMHVNLLTTLPKEDQTPAFMARFPCPIGTVFCSGDVTGNTFSHSDIKGNNFLVGGKFSSNKVEHTTISTTPH